jgi:two-component system sensor histidine kinase SenX3
VLTIDGVNTEVVAGLAAIVGLVVGVAAVLAFRYSEQAQRRIPEPRSGVELPPGIASVLAVLPSSAVVIDSGDRVLRASSAARAFGLVRGDRLVISDLLALARQVRKDGEIRESEIEVAGRVLGREPTSFNVRVAPLGQGGLVLVLAEDQSEHRRVEAVRRDFVANVSHELKTPVGALSLLAETMESAADDPEAVRRFAGRMQHEAARLINVVQDVITLSQVQDGQPPTSPKRVELDTIVTDAVDHCRMKADAKTIQLVTSGQGGVAVRGDPELLKTAVRNLTDNAVNYSPENTRVVVVTRPAPDGMAEISVTDQGIGIPEGEIERIFERFYRVDSARSRSTGGTGLGLAIVKHVATTHGGEVSVWSKEGAGSTFTLRLPMSNERAPAIPGARAPEEVRP